MATEKDIVVNPPGKPSKLDEYTKESERMSLAAHVVGKVQAWQQVLDEEFKVEHQRYFDAWMMKYKPSSKTRNSERSTLISPATLAAIDATVGELEEGLFAKGRWYDIAESLRTDLDPGVIAIYRMDLQEEMKLRGVPKAIAECILIAAVFGKGTAKIVLDTAQQRRVVNENGAARIRVEDKFSVMLESLMPYAHVYDATAKRSEDMLGEAHVYVSPRHVVTQLQRSGVYNLEQVGSYSESGTLVDLDYSNQNTGTLDGDKVYITEYHGLVPRDLLERANLSEGEVIVNPATGEPEETDVDMDDLVEAIVVVANNGTVLKANENPLMMKDRPFVSYQHDTIPDKFQGRGVAEKGDNSQRSLNADLRSRMDAIAMIVHPMMGMDISRMPKNLKLTVGPGKTIKTNGNPNEILNPMNFGTINPIVFNNGADLERMHGQATGASDSVGGGSGQGAETLGGMSMQMGNFIKRNNRTMRNIEEFVGEIVRKVAWRYMEFTPERYPPTEIEFKIISTMGMIAREAEMQNLSNLLNSAQPGSAGYWMIMRAMIELSSTSVREKMLPLIEQQLQVALNPAPAEPTFAERIEARKVEMNAMNSAAANKVNFIRSQVEIGRLALSSEESVSKQVKDETQAILNVAKAEAEEVGQQLQQYSLKVDTMLKASEQSTEGSLDATRQNLPE